MEAGLEHGQGTAREEKGQEECQWPPSPAAPGAGSPPWRTRAATLSCALALPSRGPWPTGPGAAHGTDQGVVSGMSLIRLQLVLLLACFC